EAAKSTQKAPQRRLRTAENNLPAAPEFCKTPRKFYDLYLDREGQGGRLPPDAAGFQGSFADFARRCRYDPAKHRVVHRFQGTRAWACFGKVSCSVGFSFYWETRDIFVGQYMATFVPHDKGNDWELCERLPGPGEPPRPESTRFLTAAVRSACRDGGAVRSALQRWIREEDARLAEYVEFAQRCDVRGEPYNRKASTDVFKSFAFQSGEERTAVREWLLSGRPVSFDGPEDREMAFLAIQAAMVRDLGLRGAKPARRYNFCSTIRASFLLVCQWLRPEADAAFELIKTVWNLQRPHHLPARTWSPGQAELLRVARAALSVEDSNELRLAPVLSQFVHVFGEPGCGKSEALIYAAHEASQREARVLIACPTGVLVGQYRDRLPSTQFITVETIHSAWRVLRDYDRKTYSPPTRLTQYDAVFIDEVSQLDDHIFEILLQVLPELPQRPLVVFAGDLSQLQPVGSGGFVRHFLSNDGLQHIHMQTHEFARSKDPVLLDFLSDIRARQPTRRALKDFFGGRHLGRNLPRAVAECRRVCQEAAPGDKDPVTWLTCTSEGAQKVNYEYLRQAYGLDQAAIDAHPAGFRSDPDYGDRRVVVQVGMWLRMTKNIDKDRGFCNGATGTVAFVLSDGTSGPPVFIVRLAHGAYVLVHPIKTEHGRRHTAAYIPAVYGYGMTTRKAQGASLRRVVLYFELWRPACRGFAYVGLSRVSYHDGAFYFGRLRRTDWLPVGGPGAPAEQVERGADSTDDSDLSDEGDSDADGGLALLAGQGSGAAADYSALFGADAPPDSPSADAEAGGGQGGASDGDYAALFGPMAGGDLNQ
ncbi:unnamed protein product, partial [Prorocentrum cordatum]